MDANITEAVTAAIRRNSPLGTNVEFDHQTHLIRTGVLDSLAMLGVTAELQQRLGCEISDDLIRPSNFSTPHKIMQLVASLTSAD